MSKRVLAFCPVCDLLYFVPNFRFKFGRMFKPCCKGDECNGRLLEKIRTVDVETVEALEVVI